MLLTPDIVPTLTATGASARVAAHVAPRFRVGDRVRVRNHNPVTHTRLPGYLRGKLGIVEQDHGVFAFPDTHAHGLGEKPQHCYSVRFTAITQVGERITCTGTVIEKFQHDGERRVRVALRTTNQDGQVKLSGEAVAALP